MRKHLAIAAMVVVLAVPGLRAAAAAGPQSGEVLALFGHCFVETAGAGGTRSNWVMRCMWATPSMWRQGEAETTN
jgi:hypothetical protein